MYDVNYKKVDLMIPKITKIVKAILIINITIFIISQFFPKIINLFLWDNKLIINNFELWRLLTFSFIHTDVLNLVFNSLMLWYIGSELESKWGTKNFIKFFLLINILSSSLSLLFPINGIFWGSNTFVLGLITAYAIYFPEQIMYFMFIIPIKMKWFVAIIASINLLMLKSGIFSTSASSSLTYLLQLNGILISFIYIKYSTKINQQKFIFFKRNIFKNNINQIKNFKVTQYTHPKKNHVDNNLQEDKNESVIDINSKVNEILDKIKSQGYNKLNKEEKIFLNKADYLFKNKIKGEE